MPELRTHQRSVLQSSLAAVAAEIAARVERHQQPLPVAINVERRAAGEECLDRLGRHGTVLLTAPGGR
jgi:hypothetical protein